MVHAAGGLHEQEWTDLDAHEAEGVLLLNRDLRVHQILEGTNEIMRLIIARALDDRL